MDLLIHDGCKKGARSRSSSSFMAVLIPKQCSKEIDLALHLCLCLFPTGVERK